MINFLLEVFQKVSPPTPDAIYNWFEAFEPLAVNFWFHMALFIVIAILGYLLTAFQRRYGRSLTLIFTSFWLLYQPFQEGLITLDLPNHPFINPGIIQYITAEDGLLYTIQFAVGLMALFVTLRFLFQVFIIYPMKYRNYRHEGRAYHKQAEREEQRMKKKQLKKQRKQKKQGRQQKEPTEEPSEPKIPKAKKPSHADQDIDYYL